MSKDNQIRKVKQIIEVENILIESSHFGGVSKSMLKLNEAIIDIKEG